MEYKLANRMDALPPYPFAEINRMRDEVKARGVDVVDLGIGDPDLPTHDVIIERMKKEISKPENHNYPPYLGTDDFRKAIGTFCEERFSLKLNAEKEILPLIGSKEGIFHFPFVVLNEGDYSLVPDPGYPVYSIATKLFGGKVHEMPLNKENNFLPDLGKIPSEIVKKAKIIFVNYPNNPTSACASIEFFKDLLKFAEKNNIFVCHDAAYSEVYFGKEAPISFLNVDREKRVSIEFHSLSKTFNMTGWRVGFAIGNEKLVKALGTLKTNMDSGIFKALQRASIAGLENWRELTSKTRNIFEKRANGFTKTLRDLGFKFNDPQGTFYIWVEVPGKMKSAEFTKKILDKIGVVVTPGLGMGKNGDSYFRISLTAPDARLSEALNRFKQVDIKSL